MSVCGSNHQPVDASPTSVEPACAGKVAAGIGLAPGV